jgi:hypothetical protein
LTGEENNMKVNCWEFKKCGREPGGDQADELGICLAATATAVDGVHGGKNGGRACWAVCGTLCGGEVQGTFADKIGNCKICDFYKQVWEENIEDFVHIGALIRMLKEEKVSA